MVMADKFDSGIKVRLLVDRTTTGDLRNPHWEITITKTGIRRLIRFLLAGGTRNYGNPLKTNINIFRPQNLNVRAAVVRGGARKASRDLRKKINFQKTVVKIDGWYPKVNRQRVNELLDKAEDASALHKKDLDELKVYLAGKASELGGHPDYQSFKHGSLFQFVEEHDGQEIRYSAITDAQKRQFLQWAAGGNPAKWNNLLQSNVFDHTSRTLLERACGTRVLLAMILMGMLDQAESVINTIGPTMNPVFR